MPTKIYGVITLSYLYNVFKELSSCTVDAYFAHRIDMQCKDEVGGVFSDILITNSNKTRPFNKVTEVLSKPLTLVGLIEEFEFQSPFELFVCKGV